MFIARTVLNRFHDCGARLILTDGERDIWNACNNKPVLKMFHDNKKTN
jgi:hypothetical protein